MADIWLFSALLAFSCKNVFLNIYDLTRILRQTNAGLFNAKTQGRRDAKISFLCVVASLRLCVEKISLLRKLPSKNEIFTSALRQWHFQGKIFK